MSNHWRAEVQAASADVNLELSIEFGEQVTYTHRGVSVSVYCLPQRDGPTEMRNWGGTRSREMTRTFRIPMQIGFPPSEDPFPDDTITDENGTIYVIRDWVSDDLDAVYTFKDCINTTAKNSGVV